jgi:hypothetical protein
MKPFLSATLFGALVLLTFTACNSGHLTRPNAKVKLEQLAKQEQQENPFGPHSMSVKVGTVANCEPAPNSPPGYFYDPVQRGADYAVLSATEYITIKPIKKGVWDVELTERGKQNIALEKYAHEQKGECDEWQVTFPLSKYDHLDVTGIVEEGVHGKVDATFTFVITPVGMAVRKVASALVFETDKKTYGEKLATDFLDGNVKSLLGDDLVYTAPDKDRYVKQATFAFDKYDDGWKVSTKDK